jgi:uncharacterized membrane protein
LAFCFFLPLVAMPESKYGKFHANQGLVLFNYRFCRSASFLSIIPIIGWILLPFFGIAVTVFAILGIVNAVQGKAKDLPLFGKLKIIK